MELNVKDNPARHRFEATVEGKTAFVDYRRKPGVIKVMHTEVPKELEGRGIASSMTRQVLQQIAAERLELIPICPYMQSYLKKHPEYQSLINIRFDKSKQ
ncbi:GNAT family N-acetyltransferase [Adhaeribacter soli]|uniref:N-acetyltransferase n=1 Tax=Adhaeribacter soli TaxID=2607655 RepID=A0A5N1ILY6_9BACT|nr:GNAT family N-acetyltransferase [Adhaeribacter soli]KAA9325664.1 N-acetyltransferase [Adhaeribacter soli]